MEMIKAAIGIACFVNLVCAWLAATGYAAIQVINHEKRSWHKAYFIISGLVLLGGIVWAQL